MGATREEKIESELLQVHDEAYGTTSRGIKAHIIDDVVLVLVDAAPTTAERTLIQSGNGDAVQASREAFQDAIAPVFNAIVERATGRRVESFLSRMSIEPLYSVELFRLKPKG